MFHPSSGFMFNMIARGLQKTIARQVECQRVHFTQAVTVLGPELIGICQKLTITISEQVTMLATDISDSEYWRFVCSASYVKNPLQQRAIIIQLMSFMLGKRLARGRNVDRC